MIDFGRAIDTKFYPPGIHFQGDCHADSFRTPEMITGQPWTYQIDCFGICAVAHCLLHGKYMELVQEPVTNRWKAKEPFRRYWDLDLWNDFFDSYLNVPNCESIPPLSQFRERFENFLLSDPQRAKSIKPGLIRLGVMMSKKG